MIHLIHIDHRVHSSELCEYLFFQVVLLRSFASVIFLLLSISIQNGRRVVNHIWENQVPIHVVSSLMEVTIVRVQIHMFPHTVLLDQRLIRILQIKYGIILLISSIGRSISEMSFILSEPLRFVDGALQILRRRSDCSNSKQHHEVGLCPLYLMQL